MNELERWRTVVAEYKRWDARTDDIHASQDEWELYQEAVAKLEDIAPIALDKLLVVVEAARGLPRMTFLASQEHPVTRQMVCLDCYAEAKDVLSIQHHAGCRAKGLETALAALTEVNEADEIQDV